MLVGIFFMFAVAAYWIFERDTRSRSCSRRAARAPARDAGHLDPDRPEARRVRARRARPDRLRRGLLSAGFFAIGLPYWLLIGAFAGVVEIVPVIGPLAAGALAVGVGLTQSWHMALFAGLIVLGVRQLEDYVVVPRVLGHAIGLSPLLVLVSVTAVGILLGGFYVLLAIPIAAVLATLVDVVVRDVDPAEQEVPAVLFTAPRRRLRLRCDFGVRAAKRQTQAVGPDAAQHVVADGRAASGSSAPRRGRQPCVRRVNIKPRGRSSPRREVPCGSVSTERHYALRQRPKTRPPRVKPRPNVPRAKPPIAIALRPGESRCQRPSASCSSARQRLAAALLAHRAAGAQTEVQVVEDLGGVVGHCVH